MSSAYRDGWIEDVLQSEVVGIRVLLEELVQEQRTANLLTLASTPGSGREGDRALGEAIDRLGLAVPGTDGESNG